MLGQCLGTCRLGCNRSILWTFPRIHSLSQSDKQTRKASYVTATYTVEPSDASVSGRFTPSQCPAGFAPAPLTRSHIAYEVIKGALVRHSTCIEEDLEISTVRGCVVENWKPPPTVLLVHGILGSKRNMQAFARRLMDGYPSWQAIVIDLRCHGASALQDTPPGPHGVESAAHDILGLLSDLKLFPRVLIGHSFGGKVVMSMAQQFGQRLPRPVQVWVLDSLPGEVRSGEENRKDHPHDLIKTLKSLQLPVVSRAKLIDDLVNYGFSSGVASWMTTNLRPINGQRGRNLTWTFNLDGVEEMYRSYESTNLWPLLADPPQGLKLDFVRAEGSNYRWGGGDAEKIEQLGHDVHVLRNSGHWVHTDNPDGLFDIIRHSMGNADLHMRRTAHQTRSFSRA